ncbi:4Fe-4S dicluster domain-containing protein [Caldithrix abyssi]|uniref:Heterodisulfide reductase subunit C/quinone-modifying oxidoreductase subunit QmoC n=1 Tax=Caldithrix abyssi DSM 13497 TaxID=880073 RepID=H1XT87_CALAY|nr:4Fe-4S dicluster domain-containing protein [Caldithrix abyssi]APF18668.1 heterodisulfide reductase subunit C/quinone-modifying oxidoreductase subunit QmoC [Caldithrix abyssi DSM 13497]EHO42654.1 putative heterodisulfide reductase, C subunit [Caldithrix abyssi DSM 13497]
MQILRKVKYENELNPEFTSWLSTIPGGERVRECMQCGTCSSICPVSIYMDITPRRLMAMADSGFKDDVLQSFTIWLCASCYACTVNCPKDIKITDIMYGLKRRAIEEKVLPRRRFAIPILARSFVNMVKKNGRITESRLVMTLALKIGLLHLLRMAPLGWSLMRAGRLSLKKEQVQNKEQIKTMLKAVEA